MWTDATAHNRSVPTNIVGTHGLLAKKRQEWADDEGRNPYASHARVEQLSSTFAAAGHVTKRTSARVQQVRCSRQVATCCIALLHALSTLWTPAIQPNTHLA